MTRKIAIISGSRADAGLLMGLMSSINKHPSLELQLFVTGMHLCEQYGMTYTELENEGFTITNKVIIPLTDNSPHANAIALGEGIIGFSHTFQKHQPDLVIILGDRFEILAAVEAAMMLQIPVAHLHGGELTLGAIDDSIRHAISKMSQLHFAATEEYRQRLIQMGEQPDRVYNVGATAMDNILSIPLLDKMKLEEQLNIKLHNKIFLITWHPETIKQDKNSILSELNELFKALEEFPEHQIIFTKANADSGGQKINQLLEDSVQSKKNYYLFSSLGIQCYLSMVKIADVIIGNSSSGLIEVPAMKTASVNIGHRQDGRYKAGSVVDCLSNHRDIAQAISIACSKKHKIKCQSMNLPYGDGQTCSRITKIISEIDLTNIMHKPFYNLPISTR